jgi:hypothetical protein
MLFIFLRLSDEQALGQGFNMTFTFSVGLLMSFSTLAIA